MYFPYLRGKQFELLALREMTETLAPRGVTCPVIEPVRKFDQFASGPSGLERCVSITTDARIPTVVVVNPSVGELSTKRVSPQLGEKLANSSHLQFAQVGLLLRRGVSESSLVEDLRKYGLEERTVLPIVLERLDDSSRAAAAMSELNYHHVMVSDSIRNRYLTELLGDRSRVNLRDGFPWQPRNIDYLNAEESDFSDDYQFVEEEGWYGFGDYLTIGSEYTDGGFTPRAVAIHWTYVVNGGPIQIRHFVSDTNDDSLDVAGKFLEAARKLVTFLDDNGITSKAAEVVRGHVSSGTYPGLGVVKKLSIMNHLELVSGILIP